MNRRAFLGSAGMVLSMGLVGRQTARRSDPVTVRVWFSEAAAEYDSLPDRIEGYLGGALEAAVGEVALSFAPSPVRIPAEGGRNLLAVRWPRMVVEGTVGMRHIDPVDDVNLLVTDGDPTRQPAGYARPRVAAATGAEYVARMPPADETDAVVPYSVRAAATQLLLHECGHALGAGHEHGHADVRDGAVVASPMIGSYLWADERDREKHVPDECACGGSYPGPTAAPERRLGLRYGDCAVRALQ